MEKSSGKNPVECHSAEDISKAATRHPTSSGACSSRTLAVSGVGSSGDVVVHDTYECRECNATYYVKDAYLRHVLLFHSRTMRKYQGPPVGQGVIIKDDKFVCQFCHKVFQEKHSYTCHVGVHVRNFNRGAEDLFEEETIDPAGMSLMQAMAATARRAMKAKSVPAIDSSNAGMGTSGVARSISEVPSPAAGGMNPILLDDE